MATSTARKPNPESYLPPGEVPGEGNYAPRIGDPNPQYVPPTSSGSWATGMTILGVLVVLAVIMAVYFGTSERVDAPAITDTPVTQPVQPDNQPPVQNSTGQTQTTDPASPVTTAPVTPAPAPTAEQPAAPEPTSPPAQTQPAQPGTGTTVQ